MTNRIFLKALRTPTPSDPLRILVSSCLTGVMCGYDGTANGEYPSVLKLLNLDTVRLVKFCPEEFSFGSPREVCDLHGGTGDDVLEGKARMLSESGIDWTEGIVRAAEKMAEVARREDGELCVMMDVSGACGSQAIYDGNRFSENKGYQIGAGVAAAKLKREGFQIISQRDYASLEILYQKLDPTHVVNEKAIDHHETAWYKSYFNIN